KYPGRIYIIGPDFFADFPHIERDVRTPSYDEVVKMLRSLDIFDNVEIVTRETIKQIPSDNTIVMPIDEVTEKIAERYFKDREIIFDSVFLKWTPRVSMAKTEISPDRIISREDRDRVFIQQANETAEKSSDWWRRIGAVIVKDDKSIITAFNSHVPSDFNLDSAGDPRTSFNPGERIDLSTAIHAEAKAISQAARKGIALEGATVYVSTFPCPGCAKLIAESGIKKVYYDQGYSLLDAENLLKDFGIEIIRVDTEVGE
ncbi:MAG: hypothetical protein RLY57_642, partial [Candidatus Parcubacteria bacterium]